MTGPYEEYERIIRPIEAQMVRSIWGVTRDADDAEEAFQEALTNVWRRWGRIRRHPNPHALVLRICINAAYDHLRKKLRRRKREALAGVETEVASTATPADAMVRREQESAILRAIGRLSRNQATAVLMRLVEGQSYAEIAGILGCKDSTARKHVERGRERLRTMLGPIDEPSEKESA